MKPQFSELPDLRESKLVRWKSHPVRDDYPKSLLLIGIIMLVCLAAYFGFCEIWYSILAFVFLFVSLLRYFLPTIYELDDKRIKTTFLGRTQSRLFSEFRNFYVYGMGVHLSPFEKPSPLDSFRGKFVRFNNNKKEVIAFLEARLRKV